MKHSMHGGSYNSKKPSTKLNKIANNREYGDMSREYVPKSTPKRDQTQGAQKLLKKKANVIRGGGSA